MGVREKDEFFITLCIPQIATYVKYIGAYARNLATAKRSIEKIITQKKIRNSELHVNTRDNYKLRELYLTAIGSSIESGDEGLAGRGNRVNKLISPTRPMSMEGACGKNPVNHIGKIYYVAAFDLAHKIHTRFGIENEVYRLTLE